MMPHIRHHSLVALLAMSLAGCAGTSASPGDRLADGQAQVLHPGGLMQRVALEPAVLVDGRDVQVRSTLRNDSGAPLALESRICGLDYEGSLDLTHPPEVLKCAGYSSSGTLAPGDSVVVADLMRVTSAPGTYELRVRHAISPAQSLSLQVVVRAP